MDKIGIRIRKPDDSREYYPTVTVTSDNIINYSSGWEYNIEYLRNEKRPDSCWTC